MKNTNISVTRRGWVLG